MRPPGDWNTGKSMALKSITSRRNGFWGGTTLIALLLVGGFQEPLTAQADFPPLDTTYNFDDYFGDFFEEEGFSDEFFGGEESYDDFFQGESFGGDFGGDSYEDNLFQDSYFGEEEFQFDDGSSFDLGGEEFYFDESAFDESYDGMFLDEAAVGATTDQLPLADDQAGEVELEEIREPRVREPRVIRGYTAKVSIISPWLVGLGFDAFWYSYIDTRIALDLPRKSDAGLLAPGYTLEVATFSFENLHPSGGEFSGVALQALMRIPVGPIEVAGGGGMYASGSDIRGGMLFGASYTVPFISFLAITLESRFTYVADAAPGGAAYWLDAGGSIGYRF